MNSLFCSLTTAGWQRLQEWTAFSLHWQQQDDKDYGNGLNNLFSSLATAGWQRPQSVIQQKMCHNYVTDTSFLFHFDTFHPKRHITNMLSSATFDQLCLSYTISLTCICDLFACTQHVTCSTMEAAASADTVSGHPDTLVLMLKKTRSNTHQGNAVQTLLKLCQQSVSISLPCCAKVIKQSATL